MKDWTLEQLKTWFEFSIDLDLKLNRQMWERLIEPILKENIEQKEELQQLAEANKALTADQEKYKKEVALYREELSRQDLFKKAVPISPGHTWIGDTPSVLHPFYVYTSSNTGGTHVIRDIIMEESVKKHQEDDENADTNVFQTIRDALKEKGFTFSEDDKRDSSK